MAGKTPGAPSPTFSANGTNAAKNTTATFSQAGTYTCQATLTDPAGLTATSGVTVTVNQTVSSVGVTPGYAALPNSVAQQFTATGTFSDVLKVFKALLKAGRYPRPTKRSRKRSRPSRVKSRSMSSVNRLYP